MRLHVGKGKKNRTGVSAKSSSKPKKFQVVEEDTEEEEVEEEESEEDEGPKQKKGKKNQGADKVGIKGSFKGGKAKVAHEEEMEEEEEGEEEEESEEEEVKKWKPKNKSLKVTCRPPRKQMKGLPGNSK